MKGRYVFDEELSAQTDPASVRWLRDQLRDGNKLVFGAPRPIDGHFRHAFRNPGGSHVSLVLLDVEQDELRKMLSEIEAYQGVLLRMISMEEGRRMVRSRLPADVTQADGFEELFEKSWRASFSYKGQVFDVSIDDLVPRPKSESGFEGPIDRGMIEQFAFQLEAGVFDNIAAIAIGQLLKTLGRADEQISELLRLLDERNQAVALLERDLERALDAMDENANIADALERRMGYLPRP